MSELRHPILITEREAAFALGVSAATLKSARLHRLPQNPLRNLPYVQIGRSIRYRRSDVERFIADNLVEAS